MDRYSVSLKRAIGAHAHKVIQPDGLQGGQGLMEARIGPGRSSLVDDRRLWLKNAVIKGDIVIPSEYGEIVVPAIGENIDLVDVGRVARRLKIITVDRKELLVSGGKAIFPKEVDDHVEVRGCHKGAVGGQGNGCIRNAAACRFARRRRVLFAAYHQQDQEYGNVWSEL